MHHIFLSNAIRECHAGNYSPFMTYKVLFCFLLYCINTCDLLTDVFQVYLTHCGLVVPYGNIDVGQHWLR